VKSGIASQCERIVTSPAPVARPTTAVPIDRRDQAVQLGGGQLELAEDLAAVLDRQTFDGYAVVELLHLLGEVEQLGLVAIGDVDLGERDRAVGADLPLAAFGVRARDRDPFHRVDLGEDVFHRRLDLRVVDPLIALVSEDDLAGESGGLGVDRLELLDDLGRLGVGEREVGAERRTGGAGGGIDTDEDRHPDREDGDPLVRDTPTCKSCKHAREARRGVRLLSVGLAGPML
jgi:hypothetical protein